MKVSFKRAILNFVWAYIIVTILAYSISIMAAIIFKLPSYQDLGVSLFEDPAFVMTVPYHLLINLLVWTLFSYWCLRKQNLSEYGLKDIFYLSTLWLVLALIVDFVCFVLIKTPLSLTPHQFYVEYQPWISITYLLVFISPFVSYKILQFRRG